MKNQDTLRDLYKQVTFKASQIEQELKRINRWQGEPLPPERFENMGAFGSHTMALEQWIQFVLLPRVAEIIAEAGEFPKGNGLSTYATRNFDGDDDKMILKDLLYDLDEIINQKDEEVSTAPTHNSGLKQYRPEQTEIPDVVFALANLLHTYRGDDLEAQLQSFDAFINILAETNRPVIAALLTKAAEQTEDDIAKARIQKAADDVAQGRRAAEPYNHQEHMRKYREQHRKDFPE